MPYTGVIFPHLRRDYLQSDFLSTTFANLPSSDVFLRLISLFNYHKHPRGILGKFNIDSNEASPVENFCNVMLYVVTLICVIEDDIHNHHQHPYTESLFTHQTDSHAYLKEQYLHFKNQATLLKDAPGARLDYYLDLLIEHLHLLVFLETTPSNSNKKQLEAAALQICASIEAARLTRLRTKAQNNAREITITYNNALKQRTLSEIHNMNELAKHILTRLNQFGVTLFEHELQRLGVSPIDAERHSMRALSRAPKTLPHETPFIIALYNWLTQIAVSWDEYYGKPRQFINIQYIRLDELIRLQWDNTQNHRGLLNLATAFSFPKNKTQKKLCCSLLNNELQTVYSLSEELFQYYIYSDSAHKLISSSRFFSKKGLTDNVRLRLIEYEKLLGELFKTGKINDLQSSIERIKATQTGWHLFEDESIQILKNSEVLLPVNR